MYCVCVCDDCIDLLANCSYQMCTRDSGQRIALVRSVRLVKTWKMRTEPFKVLFTHSGNEGFFKLYMVIIPLLCFRKSSKNKVKHMHISLLLTINTKVFSPELRFAILFFF